MPTASVKPSFGITSFDPVLTAILADPDKDILLRWVNKVTPEGHTKASHSRPDAVISTFSQPCYDKTIGHGEAKVAEPTRNADGLCRDLLRLAMFGKGSNRLGHSYKVPCLSDTR
ncbi:hypothetical protein BCR43DRAFT_481079 [Syncephalastrum racemosum]|uniref:Uncharacterized protein n=1 Tax=Syncephalastrum racemosum TaxID=13706 RepID=A0A1X2HRE7_SYNRA|nr:hypothetical protein BCR43DRAFT_481079 [Syncephalastrum racemosum]